MTSMVMVLVSSIERTSNACGRPIAIGMGRRYDGVRRIDSGAQNAPQPIAAGSHIDVNRPRSGSSRRPAGVVPDDGTSPGLLRSAGINHRTKNALIHSISHREKHLMAGKFC